MGEVGRWGKWRSCLITLSPQNPPQRARSDHPISRLPTPEY
ncbi:hypothetical protein ACQY1Z_00010 [Microcystis aeruginosa FBCC-A68]|nr:hypothetical protein [Microcystis aeruginosa]